MKRREGMEITVEIYNMNNMTLEVSEVVDSKNLFQQELELVSHLKQKEGFFKIIGVEIEGLRFRVCNRDKFIRFVIERYFTGYSITRTIDEGVGQPDYTLVKDNNKIYLELKMGIDTLRQTQINWFANNKEKNNKLIFIDYADDFSRLQDGQI